MENREVKSVHSREKKQQQFINKAPTQPLKISFNRISFNNDHFVKETHCPFALIKKIERQGCFE